MIKQFSENGPVGVLKPCCTITYGRTRLSAWRPRAIATDRVAAPFPRVCLPSNTAPMIACVKPIRTATSASRGDAFASVSRSAACRWHCGRLARTAPSLFISALTKSASSICGKRLQPVDVWTSQERCPQAHRPTAATAKARLDKHPNNQPDVSPMSPNSVPLDPGPNRSVAGRGQGWEEFLFDESEQGTCTRPHPARFARHPPRRSLRSRGEGWSKRRDRSSTCNGNTS